MPLVEEEQNRAEFEKTILPHLDAAYNLARWLTRNDQAAEDMVQESFIRGFKFFNGFRGGNPRAWILTIVRNTCFTWLAKDKTRPVSVELNDEIGTPDAAELDPQAIAARGADAQALRQAIDGLPPEFKEVLVLRELEGLSYDEIAEVTDLPLGTVMSRLARARRRLETVLAPPERGGH